MTLDTLTFMVLQHIESNQNCKDYEWCLKKYVKNNNTLKIFYIFLHTVLDYSKYFSRRTFISKTILENRKELSIERTVQIRKKSDKNLDLVLSTDERFI